VEGRFEINFAVESEVLVTLHTLLCIGLFCISWELDRCYYGNTHAVHVFYDDFHVDLRVMNIFIEPNVTTMESLAS
jgi:hypothetical protein